MVAHAFILSTAEAEIGRSMGVIGLPELHNVKLSREDGLKFKANLTTWWIADPLVPKNQGRLDSTSLIPALTDLSEKDPSVCVVRQLNCVPMATNSPVALESSFLTPGQPELHSESPESPSKHTHTKERKQAPEGLSLLIDFWVLYT